MTKVLITRTSDYSTKEIKEYESLDQCVKDIWASEQCGVVVDVEEDDDRYDFHVEIYDDYRE